MAERESPRSDEHLQARAGLLNQKYFQGALTWNSICYSARQEHRRGSCSFHAKTIRISERLAKYPQWVEDYVIVHELAHLKRHDIALGYVIAGLHILHWFNPLVWLAFHRMRVDRELACDALALSYAQEEESRPYGRTIIKLLESFGGSAWAPSLAGTVENKNQMKERISMIAEFRSTNRGPALAGVLFIGLGLITLTDAQTGGTPPAEEAAALSPMTSAPVWERAVYRYCGMV